MGKTKNIVKETPQETETQGKDTRLIREITLRNILSFGPETEPFELRPLNVLIGPNGSGKSNLIDAIGLMRATTKSLREHIMQFGGVTEWIWNYNMSELAQIKLVFFDSARSQLITHLFAFTSRNGDFIIKDELIEATNLKIKQDNLRSYSFDNGKPKLVAPDGSVKKLLDYRVEVVDGENVQVIEFDPSWLFDDRQSVLAQINDPLSYKELALVARAYQRLRIFDSWTFSRMNKIRMPQDSSVKYEGLKEDYSNLAYMLQESVNNPNNKKKIIGLLKDFMEDFDDYNVRFIPDRWLQVIFNESDKPIPATRLSDGTLRYLCLLAILCDPEPPPLICIEEPELGLHPDIIGKLGELLIEASSRTQLIVTTHSDILVEALSDTPESVVVCEKHDGRTVLHRLTKDEVEPWREKYKLGELWLRGGIGGTRW